MGIDLKPVLYADLRCTDCLRTFDLWSAIGPSDICPLCWSVRVSDVLSGVPGACGYHVLPVDGNAVTCGLRTDRPKKQRRHPWVSLGMDTQNLGDKGFWDVELKACIDCGRFDKGSSSDPSAVDRNEEYVSTVWIIDNHVNKHEGCTPKCSTVRVMIDALPVWSLFDDD